MSTHESPSSISQIPDPNPLPTPPEKKYTLSERINLETRPIHSQLNRLILVRLPLALPPYTSNPSRYVSGILHIAPIYTNFESLWQSIIEEPSTPEGSASGGLENGEDARIHAILSHLRLPGLLRASRLRADVRALTGISEDQAKSQIATVAQSGKLEAFIAHTTLSVNENPHVLLAYAWVLYMALFSGGRYLRASLQEAGGLGATFWTRSPSPIRPERITNDRARRRPSSTSNLPPHNSSQRSTTLSDPSGSKALVPGLEFFNFLGDEDGEDIKTEFKKRVNETSPLLTSVEQEDIIREAQIIFEFMVDMVAELDRVLETDGDDIDSVRLQKTARTSTAIHKAHLLHKFQHPNRSESESGRKGYLETLTDGVAAAGSAFLNFAFLGKGEERAVKVQFADKVGDMKSSTEATEGEREIDVRFQSTTMLLAPFGVLLFLVLWYGFTLLIRAG